MVLKPTIPRNVRRTVAKALPHFAVSEGVIVTHTNTGAFRDQ